ncbi:MAG: transporter substrate-binding domain-containing protein [Schwartzia sp.]|nr:transporter substrate-binding domain-containing protein [Schwartzia sp. (in: firmicutes)]
MRKFLFILSAVLLIILTAVQPISAEKNSSRIRVGYYENGAFQTGASPGAIRRGYAYEYYRKISEYTGWRYEYVYGTFAELYKMLLDGQIDLLAGLAKTDKRLSTIGYPDFPMGSETYNIIKHNGDDRITSAYETLNDRRIGVLDSAIVQVLKKFLNDHNINADVVVFNDYSSMMYAFEKNYVEAMVVESDGTRERRDTELLYAFGTSDYYLCVSKTRPDLLEALNKAQVQLMLEEPNFINSLKIKYDVVNRSLSEKEKKWLAEHDTLRIGYLNNYLPYSDTDHKGHVTGLLKDLIPRILEELEISGLNVTYSEYDSYEDMLIDLGDDYIDVAFPVGGGLFFTEESGIFQSNPVLPINPNLVFANESASLEPKILSANKNNLMQYYFIKTNFPDAEIYFYSSIDECLKAIVDGTVDGTTVNGIRVNDLLKKRQFRGLSIKPLSATDSRCFGVTIGNEGLLKLLNRGIHVMGRDQIEPLAYKYLDGLYTRTMYDILMDNLLPIGLALAAVSLLIIAFFARESRNAKHRIKEKEESEKILEAKNKELDENKQALIASNKKLAEAAQKEQAANVAKSQFLSNMSHEIRTPINAIMGMNEMICREASAPNIREYAENIRTASSSLLGIINDILDFSKIEAGKIEIIPVEYEISSLLNDLINMVKTRADKKGLELHVNASPDLPTLLYGDEIRLKQVVTNILTNAVKYTEKGSVTLRISFEKTDDKNIKLKISVEDTGIGIKPEDLKKLYNPFERIEEKRNRTIEGTGLGMNITKRLLELMGSQLEVESVYGEGSKFHFTVMQPVIDWTPIGDFENAYRRAVARQKYYKERFTAPNAKVLVVDDTAMNITVIKGLLKATRVQLSDANSGRDALPLTAATQFDIIFLDHRMPDMDGVETLEAIRAQTNGKNKETPVICLTANAISGAREWYLARGFNDYITKPVDSDHLEATLIKYLPPELVSLSDDSQAGENNAENKASFSNETLEKLRSSDSPLDIDAGIQHCGSAEDYLSVLRIFLESVEEKADEIQQLFESRDWKNYTTKVHALKSSARIIGAAALSEQAKHLEDAGNQLQVEEITQKTPALLELYRSCSKLLDTFKTEDTDNSDLPEIDSESLAEAYEAIKELAASFDYNSIKLVLAELEKTRVPKELSERHNRIVDAAKKPDWDALKKIFEEA